jgi:deazaflavin-dependent oxidoreductase (nitroreductase family)
MIDRKTQTTAPRRRPRMLFGAEHVQRYRETGGEEGHDWQGTQTLILTTTGRKSGEERSTPLIYGRSGDDYLIVASKGGADDPPAWYLNLEAKPEAEIQVRADRFKVRSRVATADEKPELWKTMVAEWPAYDEYREKTERDIPVVVLERA